MHRVEETPEARSQIGGRIARARLEAGIRNKSAFARAVGVQPNTIYRYETGEIVPDIFKLETIATLSSARGAKRPAACRYACHKS